MIKFEKFLDILYPPKCPICEKVLPWHNETRMCKECLLTLPTITEPRCEKCSKPIAHKENRICFDCHKKKLYFEKGFALWLYESPIKEAIHSFKYYNKKCYGKLFAKELYLHFGEAMEALDIDVFVPIPMFKKKQRRRGYNQSEVIAKELGALCGVKVCNLIERVKDTKPQKELNDTERIKNLSNAFAINESNESFKHFVLVDDIYTTGSTINACAKLLKRTHCDAKIYFVSLCVGKGL